MVDEGVITKAEAIARIEPAHVDQLLRDTFDQGALKQATKIVNGLNASPGAAVGRADKAGCAAAAITDEARMATVTGCRVGVGAQNRRTAVAKDQAGVAAVAVDEGGTTATDEHGAVAAVSGA